MKPARPGFSLVETLVALVIFMMAIGVLAEAANNALYAITMMEVKEGRERDYGFVRDQVLAISDTQTLGLGGDVPTPSAGHAHWEAETETTSTPDLFRVTLSITLPGDASVAAESGNQTLYLLRPQWSQTDARATLMGNTHDNLSKSRTQQGWP